MTCLIIPKPGKAVPVVCLFDQKNVKGWWRCYQEAGGDSPRELTGKIEMELEILTKDDAELKPAGKGRDEPNDNPHLKDPDRPATSFSWFSSPWKTLRYIIWAQFKWYIIGGLVFILFTMMIVLFLYSAPGALAENLVASLFGTPRR